MSTTSYVRLTNGTPVDSQYINQFVDILTGVTGAPGIVVNSLQVNGAAAFATASIATSALTGTYVSTTATGSNNNIAIQSSASGSSVVITANPATNPSFDSNINIQLLPLGTGVVDFHYATTALGGGSTATLSTIGGSGPATATQNCWVKVLVNGTATFLPGWR